MFIVFSRFYPFFILDISRPNFREYYAKTIEEWLSRPFTVLAVANGNEVCGLISASIQKGH
jgi:hypothetical protein